MKKLPDFDYVVSKLKLRDLKAPTDYCRDYCRMVLRRTRRKPLEIIRLACCYIDLFSRNPSMQSNNYVVRWLYRQLLALKKNRIEEFDKVAAQNGYPNLFELNIHQNKKQNKKQNKWAPDKLAMDLYPKNFDWGDDLAVVKLICDFIDANAKLPSCTSKDWVERKLCRKWQCLKRKNLSTRPYGHPIETHLTIAIQRGYGDIFRKKIRISGVEKTITTTHQRRLLKVRSICDFIDEHGRPPRGNVKEEKKLASYLGSLKQSKKRNKRCFLPQFQVIAEERGHPQLFESRSIKKRSTPTDAKTDIIAVCEFLKRNGKLPSGYSKNPKEVMLAKRLSALKQQKRRLGKDFYEYDKLAAGLGAPGLLKIFSKKELKKRWEKKGLARIKLLCDFMDKHQRTPSLNKEEKYLSGFLANLRRSRNRNEGENHLFFDSYEKLLRARGYIKILEATKKSTKEELIEDIKAICDKFVLKGNFPCSESEDNEEIRLAKVMRFLKMKRAKGKLPKEFEEAIKQKGCSNFFRSKREQQSLQRIHMICDFVVKHGRYPRSVCKDEEELVLGRHLRGLRQAKKGKTFARIFRPEFLEIAKVRGFPDLFEPLMVQKFPDPKVAIQKICKFMDKHKRWPSTTADNDNERALGQKLTIFKSAKKGASSCKFVPEFEELAAKFGHPDLFEPIRDRFMPKRTRTINEICDYIEREGRVPGRDVKVGRQLMMMRYTRKKMGDAFKPFEQIANDRGHPDLFRVSKKATNDSDPTILIHRICDFIDCHGKFPSRSKGFIQKKLAVKLENLKRAKKGQRGVFLKVYQEIAERRGRPNLFTVQK